MKSSSFYSLEYIKILKFSQEHTTYSDHSSTSAHPLSVTESLPKLACNKSQPFFELVFVSICWALVLHIWKCLIFPISIYHVPLSPSVLPAKYKIFWENGLCGSVLISVSHIKMLCLVSGFPKKGTFTIPSDEKNMPPDGICSKREPKSVSVRAQNFFIRVSFTLWVRATILSVF